MLRADVNSDKAVQFGKWMNESNYGFIYKSMAGIFNTVEPWVDENQINVMLSDVTSDDRCIVEFFLLGYAKEKDDMLRILGRDNYEFLLDTGFACEKEKVIEPEGFAILPIGELFLIVSLPSCYKNAKQRISDIYIGSDSTKLMKYIKKGKYDAVLDLCAGSGVQGLNTANYANKIVEVELNETAYNAALLNGKINGISQDKYEVRKGDLYQVISEKFDCIISNPPFVPVPKDITFPLCGDGGEDGLDIVRTIVGGFEKFLKPSGKAYMVLECIGDEKGPYVVDCMTQVLKKGTINVSLINRQQIEFQADASAKIAISIYDDPQNYEMYYNAWMDMFKRTKATYIYPVVVEYVNNGKELEINYLRNYTKWSLDSQFGISDNIEIAEHTKQYYAALKDGKTKAVFDEEVKDLLQKCSNKSIRTAIPDSMDAGSYINKIKNTLKIVNSLNSQGVIVRK
ncbi:methyltransferase [Clostridium sp. BNL1100]|uniref:methyltransferase n=1 Tax=Clostridium sp. BNL1100 TaxID=755731 RepID=UPI00024A71B6|nr:methyltransferase [Clostridium sp. BNL1100]AEY67198.1 methyltransferase family protein [Clostridium sp. BNL1100]